MSGDFFHSFDPRATSREHETKVPLIIAAHTSMLVIACASYICRMVSRTRPTFNLGWDDYLITLATVGFNFNTAFCKKGLTTAEVLCYHILRAHALWDLAWLRSTYRVPQARRCAFIYQVDMGHSDPLVLGSDIHQALRCSDAASN